MVEKEVFIRALSNWGGQLKRVDEHAKEYLWGDVASRYMWPLTPGTSKIYKAWQADENPFSSAGGCPFDVYLTCRSPIADGFSEVNVTGTSIGHVNLSKILNEGPFEGYRLDIHYAVAYGFPDRIEILNQAGGLVIRYAVLKTRRIAGVREPSAIVEEEFYGLTRPTSRTEYSLLSARLNGDSHVGNLRNMGPSGALVMDSRLGDAKTRTYRIGDRLPTEEELARLK